MHVAIFLLHCKNWAVVATAGWLNDAELESFKHMFFDLFAMRIWDFKLFNVNWFLRF
jgi:hypothetical protein